MKLDHLIFRTNSLGLSPGAIFAVVVELWAAAAVLGALVTGDRFAQLGRFTLDQALAASIPYLSPLLLLTPAFFVVFRKPGSLSHQPQSVKIALVAGLVTGLTAWALVIYLGALADLQGVR